MSDMIPIVAYNYGSGKKSASVQTVAFNPKSLDLGRLFTDPDMFSSRKAWRRAGFDVFDPAKDIECMVAAHPSAPGYLFKKYADTNRSQTEQSQNYEARIKCAKKLAIFIQEKNLQHVVVPNKHLHDLPRAFGKANRILIVARLDVVGPDESERRYHDIAEPILRDLLTVLSRFKGLDSNSKNVQFTREGKIAFVDLENGRRRDRTEVLLKSIGDYLSKDRRKLAWKILDEL
jgi:hypothetical protein